MSMPDPDTGASTAAVCPLCGTRVFVEDTRCPDCAMILAGVGGRPDAFTRRSLWLWAAGLLAIYLVVMVIVVLAR